MTGYIVLAGIAVTVIIGTGLTLFLERRDRKRKGKNFDPTSSIHRACLG